MGILPNPKHELFAQELAKGLSAAKAYVVAGYNDNRANAGSLSRKEHVSTRVAEIQMARAERDREATERAIERTALTKEWVIERLIENTNRAMQAVEIRNQDGGTGEYKYDGSVANRSLELLGKELGMFVDRSENVNVVRDITDQPLTSAEWGEQYTTPH